MGFLCSQGRIRMEVVVGLLIVIGTMLEGTEGLKCYASEEKDPGKTEECGDNKACYRLVISNGKIKRACYTSYNKKCCGCMPFTTQADFEACLKSNGRTSTESENAQSLSLKTFLDDDTTNQGRQNVEMTVCICYTDLCNGAGDINGCDEGGGGNDDNGGGGDDEKDKTTKRSTANTQVVSGILVAASLVISNLGLGML